MEADLKAKLHAHGVELPERPETVLIDYLWHATHMHPDNLEGVEDLRRYCLALESALSRVIGMLEARSEVETVTMSLQRDDPSTAFIFGVDGYFTVESLREIEEEVRDNFEDYYDAEFADAEGTAIERFSVKRVNMHPDDGGPYWELKPCIAVAEDTGKRGEVAT